MSRESKYLFSDYELSAVLRNQEQEMLKEIDAIEGNRLLNTNLDDLCDYFEQKYKLEVPQLKNSEITVEQNEVEIDNSQDRRRIIFDRNKPFHLKGTQLSFFVPFDGERELFKCQPSTSTVGLSAAVDQGELVLSYARTDHDAVAVRSQFDRDLGEIQKNLERMAKDVLPFNDSVRDKAQRRIEMRLEKLLKDQGLVSGLGFPLKRRGDAPQTFVVPTVRRKVSMPSATTAPFVPEPTLETQEYEHILSVISNMVAVMERSPKAFQGMEEENLRDHFLVQLNGQYEGQATGETFNFEGKTDILIRVQGKNIFVAECKFWRGPDSLRKALDQLLGYATWRDTKTALLIFNRGKDFSSVLAKIPEIVESHPNFKRRLPHASETASRFILHHRDDKNREVILTVLAFEVPA